MPRAMLSDPPVFINFQTAALLGGPVVRTHRTLKDLRDVFANESAREAISPETLVYQVECHFPVPENTPGGLFFGNTFISPGKVGDEYFMTRGHFHARIECAEYYCCVRGAGVLLLMSEDRSCRTERMKPGSLHYIPGRTAHRVVNVGADTLSFGACWPADAGHNYAAIAERGFSIRVRCVDGEPKLMPAGRP